MAANALMLDVLSVIGPLAFINTEEGEKRAGSSRYI